MRAPIARPTAVSAPVAAPEEEPRPPRAFEPDAAELVMEDTEAFDAPAADAMVAPRLRRTHWLGRLAWTAGGALLSLGLGLTADRLIRDLFARYEWLGWLGVVALGLFVLAIVALAIREMWALRRLHALEDLRQAAREALSHDRLDESRAVIARLDGVYAGRPDLARAHATLQSGLEAVFDGAEAVRFAERTLMTPLDARAKALIAGSSRRVALVTAVSPRALVDLLFVGYESFRLAGAIAALYGSRPGLFGFLRLFGAVISHLAVTGGLAAGDGIAEQLVGHGLAARLSARLGEGVLNGLMTVRVGIAAMRVARPLPFDALKQPLVRDFIGDLARIGGSRSDPAP